VLFYHFDLGRVVRCSVEGLSTRQLLQSTGTVKFSQCCDEKSLQSVIALDGDGVVSHSQSETSPPCDGDSSGKKPICFYARRNRTGIGRERQSTGCAYVVGARVGGPCRLFCARCCNRVLRCAFLISEPRGAPDLSVSGLARGPVLCEQHRGGDFWMDHDLRGRTAGSPHLRAFAFLVLSSSYLRTKLASNDFP
jgi:hypothetical protein